MAVTAEPQRRPAGLAHRPGAEVVAWGPGVELPGAVSRYARDEEIFAEESDTGLLYKVCSGAVRITRIMDDGRRHIVAFHFPGDTFGLEMGATHRFTAEAVSACRIAAVRRIDIEARAVHSTAIARAFWRILSDELERTQEHSLLLGRMSACERVTAFLHEMAERAGAASGAVDLPMSRTDIADYLGLTIETVSRTFTQLQKQGAIGIQGARRIVMRTPDGFAAAA